MVPHPGPFFNRLLNPLRRLVAPPPLPPVPPPDHPCPLLLPDAPLPAWVASDPVVLKYRALLGDLPWADFPERATDRPWPGSPPIPRAPVVAAFLIKLHEGKRWMSDLRHYLVEHPALVYWLGFPRVLDPTSPFGFAVAQTVPKRRLFSSILRTLSPDALGFLLTASVQLLTATLDPADQASFGELVAGDTQALLAWVKENNPKQYIKEGRLDKSRQPNGDLDCKLGVKGRRNAAPADELPPTPTSDGQPASRLQLGSEIFWGYAAGLIVTRLPSGAEVVLAERTRPFNESDVSHFLPLMQQVEARLGHRPKVGTFDAAFDAHYVYDYFHQAGGFAAVPLNLGPQSSARSFAPDGSPLCAAGLPMPRLFFFEQRTGLVPHTREKCGCPLLHPTVTGEACPISDPHFASGGCTTHLPANAGARVRVQLDRSAPEYVAAYNQRTMVERVNSQAEALGILHPKLRRGSAIANQNTLTYVLINLRALARLRTAAEEGQQAAS